MPKKEPYEYLQELENSAWSRAESFIIIDPKNSPLSKHGKIKVAYPAKGEGKLQAFVWDILGHPVQRGVARGYGYDKLSSALAGLKFDTITFTDHPTNWDTRLRGAGYIIIRAM